MELYFAVSIAAELLSLVFIGGTTGSPKRVTALPMPPELPSTSSMAGASLSRTSTAPSAASTSSFLANALISASVSLTRTIGMSDFQPNALRRKHWANCHFYVVAIIRNLPLKLSFWWPSRSSWRTRKNCRWRTQVWQAATMWQDTPWRPCESGC